MDNINIDFKNIYGRIKPFNAVNNGPVANVRGINNLESWKALNIPYGRLHDTSFINEWLVDVHRIFRDFDADETDAKNYVFEPTDKYIAGMISAGTMPYFRLGASIEHEHKFGTYPPKDYLKWAKICEHIIRHYTEGWADGFNYDIEYFEIWNEPECTNADGSHPCWQGTDEEFCEFFTVSCNYLKEKFPNLKIGGPAIATIWATEYWEKFFSYISERGVKPDFISYHRYRNSVEDFVETVHKTNALLDKYGYSYAETHLNEWNYNCGWSGEAFINGIKAIKGIKGASFVTAIWCALHPEKLDMMMYYEGRPCSYCGLYETTYLTPLKTYYAFEAYNHLRTLGNAVRCESSNSIYSIGATNGKDSALLLTYFDDKADDKEKEIAVSLKSLPKAYSIEVYLIDEEQDLTLVDCIKGDEAEYTIGLSVNPYNIYLVKIIEK